MEYSFKEKQVLKKPFPIIIIKNFLDETIQKKIINEILDMEKETSVKKVMGGRYQYSNNLFKNNDLCNEIYNYFNQKETFEKVFDYVYNDTNQFLIKKNQYNDFLKRKNFIHKFAGKFFPKFLKNSFFLDMDFSIAKNNYYREPHHDKDTRILSFLIYQENKSDLNFCFKKSIKKPIF